jgi:hypothetical protein
VFAAQLADKAVTFLLQSNMGALSGAAAARLRSHEFIDGEASKWNISAEAGVFRASAWAPAAGVVAGNIPEGERSVP